MGWKLICSPLTDSDERRRVEEPGEKSGTFRKRKNQETDENMNWTPRSVHDTFIPICWLNRVLCLAIFETRIKSYRMFTFFYDLLSGALYFTALYYGIPLLEKNLGGFERIVFYLILHVNILVALASVITGWFNTKFLRELKDRVSALDTTLMKLGMVNPYKKEFQRIVINLSIWWSLLILVTVAVYSWTLEQFDFKFSVSLTFLMHIPNAQNFVVDLSFNVCVRCLRWRLVLMNDLIKKAIDCQTKRYYQIEPGKFSRLHKITVMTSCDAQKQYIKHFIETIKQSHLEIIRVARLVNTTFSKLILLELAVNFTLVTGCLYNFYFALLEMDIINLKVSNRLVATAMWAVVVALKVIMINRDCDRVQKEVVVMGQIIRDFNRLELDDDIRDEIQQFCMQTILHPIYFNAAGFVRLNNDCTRMFFGTVTTYLVILIQMSTTPAAMKAIFKEDSGRIF